MSLVSDIFNLAVNPRPEASASRHIKNCIRYFSLASRSGDMNEFHKSDPNSNITLGEENCWEHFSKELDYTVRHIHPKHYLKSPVVYATTARPAIQPDERATPPTSMDDAIHVVCDALVAGYYETNYGQWENLASKSYATMEELFKQAKLDQSLLRSTPIVELGAGFGTMSFVNAQGATHDQKNINYDLPGMSLLQQSVAQYLGQVTNNPSFLNNIEYLSDTATLYDKVDKMDFGIQTFYAFTEFPDGERQKLTELFKKSKFAIIASNSNFEGIDNFAYLDNLAKSIGKKVVSGPVFNPAKLNWHDNHKGFLIY